MIPPLWFFLVAAIGSVFYAKWAFAIFSVNTADKHWAWKVHQVWFNLLGSATGWAALWFLYLSLNTQGLFNLWNLGLLLLAFVGITGHLPKTIVGLVLAPGEIFSKALGRS